MREIEGNGQNILLPGQKDTPLEKSKQKVSLLLMSSELYYNIQKDREIRRILLYRKLGKSTTHTTVTKYKS